MLPTLLLNYLIRNQQKWVGYDSGSATRACGNTFDIHTNVVIFCVVSKLKIFQLCMVPDILVCIPCRYFELKCNFRKNPIKKKISSQNDHLLF